MGVLIVGNSATMIIKVNIIRFQSNNESRRIWTTSFGVMNSAEKPFLGQNKGGVSFMYYTILR